MNQKNTVFLLIYVCVLFGCEKKTDIKQDTFNVISGGEINGFKKYQIKSSEGLLFDFYLDKDDKLIQISDSTTDDFRIVFDDKELIQLVENRCSNVNKRRYQFDNVKGIVSISEENSKMLRELRLFSFGNKAPSIDYSVSREEDGLYFLSEYSSFDFSTWNDASPRYRENIILLKEPDVIVINEENLWDFQIFSAGNKYFLLKSEYDANFTAKNKIDTFSVKKIFTYSHKPLSEKDTIRFVILSENINDGMRKSFYYQLPIKTEKKR